MSMLRKVLAATTVATFGLAAQVAQALSITAPADYSTVSVLSEGMKGWKAKTLAAQKTATATKNTTARKQMEADYSESVQPVWLTWDGDASGTTYHVRVVSTHTQKTFFDADVTTNAVALGNLEIGRNYTWTVSDATATASGHFYTENEAPRAMNQDYSAIGNCRDLGGWATEDGRVVKQGMIFRSAAFDWYSWWSPERQEDEWTDAACTTLDNYWNQFLHLKTQLVLYSKGELEDAREEYQFTDSPIRNAHAVISEDICGLTFSDACYAKAFTANGRAVFKAIFTNFANRASYPIIFHCAQGKDRTGTLAFFVNGLLGVPEKSLTDDYAFTFYAKSDYSSGSAWITTFLTALRSNYPDATYPTIKDKCEAYVKSAGITQEQIDSIREIMLEDAEAADVKPSEQDTFQYVDYYFRRSGPGGSWDSDSIYWFRTPTATSKTNTKTSAWPGGCNPKGAEKAIWLQPYGTLNCACPAAGIGKVAIGKVVSDRTYGRSDYSVGACDMKFCFSNEGHSVTERPFWEHKAGVCGIEASMFWFDPWQDKWPLTLHPNTSLRLQYVLTYANASTSAVYDKKPTGAGNLSRETTLATFKNSPAYLNFLPGGDHSVIVENDDIERLFSKLGYFAGGDAASTQTFKLDNAYIEFARTNVHNRVAGKLRFEFVLGDFVKPVGTASWTKLPMFRTQGPLTINAGSTITVDAQSKGTGTYRLIASVKSLTVANDLLTTATFVNLAPNTSAKLVRSDNAINVVISESTKTAVPLPTVFSGLIYSGEAQTGVSSADMNVAVTGNVATNAGSYMATARLTGSEYCWPDGTTASKTFAWSIAKAPNEWKVAPTMSPLSFKQGDAVTVNNGTAQFGAVTASYTGADASALPVGTYTNVFTVAATDNYDGLAYSVSFEVVDDTRATKIPFPAPIEGLVYNGKVQTGVPAGQGYVLTGNTATDPGDYTAEATLLENYVWEDDTTDKVSVAWSIASPYRSLHGYLQTDATGYFLLDYVPNLAKTKVEFTVNFMSKGGASEMGDDSLCAANGQMGSKPSWDNLFHLFHEFETGLLYQNSGTNQWIEGCLNAETTPQFDAGDFDTVHVISAFRNTLTLDGETVTCKGKLPTDQEYAFSKLYLFAYPCENKIVYIVPKRVFGVKIWEIDGTGTNLVHSLVPAVSPDGQATLYDEVCFTCLKPVNAANFTVGDIRVAEIEPTVVSNLVYTGSEMQGVTEGPAYHLTGEVATNAGVYTATATLKAGYVWSDGSSEPRTYNWKIAKATNTWQTEPALSTTSWTTAEAAGVLTAGKTQFGSVTAKIRKNGGSATAFSGIALPTDPGIYTIVYTAPSGTSNYSVPSEVTKTVWFIVRTAVTLASRHEYLETDDKGFIPLDYITKLSKTKVEVTLQFLGKYVSDEGCYVVTDDSLCVASGQLNGTPTWANAFQLFCEWSLAYQNVLAPEDWRQVELGDATVPKFDCYDVTNVHTVAAYRDTLTLDGVEAKTDNPVAVDDSVASGPLLLFAKAYNQTIGTTLPKRVYSVKVWEIDGAVTNLVMDLVPAKDSANKANLYDLVSGTFPLAVNAGAFTLGPAIVQPTVNGKPVDPAKVFEPTSEDARPRSDRPIVYPTPPTLEGEVGSQKIKYSGAFATVPSHYTATLNPKDHCQVLLSLNTNATPVIVTEDATPAFVVDFSAKKVKIHLGNAKTALYYAILSSSDLSNWTSATPFRPEEVDFELELDSAAHRFYKGAVQDVPEG